MKVATISNNSISKKQFTYIGIGVVAVLTIVGIILGFLTFQTTSRASEDTPSNISIQPKGTDATISWETPRETIAVVEYGTTPDPTTFDKYAFSENPTMSHTVQMPALEPNTTYYFKIRIGDTLYDDGGQPWTFKTGEGNPEASVSPTTEPSISPSQTTSPTTTIQPTIKEASSSPTLPPTPTLEASPSSTLSPTATASPTLNITGPTEAISSTQGPTQTAQQCTFTDCKTIQQNLGGTCTTQDYIKCLFNVTAAPTVPTTPTATPISAATKSACGIDYFQSNSCKSFTWTDISIKDVSCKDTYSKYFVQCKSNSFTSSDPATWYCNETTTSNSLTVPCGTAPTPAPGQSVFCRVRAETTIGGSTDATDWMYSSTSCPRISDGSNAACGISYLQANTCRSWLWDSVNTLNPVCSPAFDHYFFQCTDNGDYSGATGRWYCNITTENHYLDLPCYNAPTPGDGELIQCRVRAEDGYGYDSHSTDWTSSAAICPTSTPTPTFTPTPTNTPTPSPTP